MKNFLNYITEGKLTNREIRTLHKDLNIYNEKRSDALIGNASEGVKDLSIRNSTIFFPNANDFPKTFNILQSAIIHSYHNICPYIDISKISEIQYARYDEGCFFKKHRDTIYTDKTNDRRTLSFSINVSDTSEYEGGELAVFDENGNEIATLSKEVGSYIIFPSIFLHEAKEVTQGTRKAIVSWIHAPENVHNKFNREIYEN